MTPSPLHPCYADLAYRLSQVCIAKRPPVYAEAMRCISGMLGFQLYSRSPCYARPMLDIWRYTDQPNSSYAEQDRRP